MLYTNLKHIENPAALQTMVSRHRNVVIVCGQMDPESVKLYRIVESLEKVYRSVHFFDMEFNHPYLLEVYRSLNSEGTVPFFFIFHEGELKQVLSDIAAADKLKSVLDREFRSPVNSYVRMKDEFNKDGNLFNNQK